jgi:hypothetical protein
MTTNQLAAVWELCRQGLPLLADEAAQCWNQGRPFRVQLGVRVGRAIELLIEQCNWEVERHVEAA